MKVFSKEPSRLERFFPGTYKLLYDPASKFGKVSLLMTLGAPIWGAMVRDILSLESTAFQKKPSFNFSLKDISLLKTPVITTTALAALANTPGVRRIAGNATEYVNSFSCENIPDIVQGVDSTNSFIDSFNNVNFQSVAEGFAPIALTAFSLLAIYGSVRLLDTAYSKYKVHEEPSSSVSQFVLGNLKEVDDISSSTRVLEAQPVPTENGGQAGFSAPSSQPSKEDPLPANMNKSPKAFTASGGSDQHSGYMGSLPVFPSSRQSVGKVSSLPITTPVQSGTEAGVKQAGSSTSSVLSTEASVGSELASNVTTQPVLPSANPDSGRNSKGTSSRGASGAPPRSNRLPPKNSIPPEFKVSNTPVQADQSAPAPASVPVQAGQSAPVQVQAGPPPAPEGAFGLQVNRASSLPTLFGSLSTSPGSPEVIRTASSPVGSSSPSDSTIKAESLQATPEKKGSDESSSSSGPPPAPQWAFGLQVNRASSLPTLFGSLSTSPGSPEVIRTASSPVGSSSLSGSAIKAESLQATPEKKGSDESSSSSAPFEPLTAPTAKIASSSIKQPTVSDEDNNEFLGNLFNLDPLSESLQATSKNKGSDESSSSSAPSGSPALPPVGDSSQNLASESDSEDKGDNIYGNLFDDDLDSKSQSISTESSGVAKNSDSSPVGSSSLSGSTIKAESLQATPEKKGSDESSSSLASAAVLVNRDDELSELFSPRIPPLIETGDSSGVTSKSQSIPTDLPGVAKKTDSSPVGPPLGSLPAPALVNEDSNSPVPSELSLQSGSPGSFTPVENSSEEVDESSSSSAPFESSVQPGSLGSFTPGESSLFNNNSGEVDESSSSSAPLLPPTLPQEGEGEGDLRAGKEVSNLSNPDRSRLLSDIKNRKPLGDLATREQKRQDREGYNRPPPSLEEEIASRLQYRRKFLESEDHGSPDPDSSSTPTPAPDPDSDSDWDNDN